MQAAHLQLPCSAGRRAGPAPARHAPAYFDRKNAARKPATVISPAKSWAYSNASGIIVSDSIARIAPAATAVVAAITSLLKCRKTAYPA